MPERAVHAAVDFAAEPAGAQALAELVRRQQPDAAGDTLDRRSRDLLRRAHQRAAELGDVRPAVAGFFASARQRSTSSHAGKSGAQRRRARHGCVRWPFSTTSDRCPERHPAGQHLEDDGAQAVDVGARVDVAADSCSGDA